MVEKIGRYLEPSERLSEIIFGLIMAMTVASSTKLASGEGMLSARIIIFAVLGCNIAWGVVDGIMYIFSNLLERGRLSEFISYAKSHNSEKVITMVENEIDNTIFKSLNSEEKKKISDEFLRSVAKIQSEKAHITRDDMLGACASFLLVFASGFIIVVPFFFLPNNVYLALKLSSVVAIIGLFSVGYQWARFTDRNKIRTGAGMVLIGFLIAAITTVLGG